MAKPEWGTKRICQSCSAPFYDMQRDPIICPKCGASFDPEAILKSRRAKPEEEAPAPEKKKEAEPEDILTEDEEDLGDDDGDDVLEDASDLGDDDMSDVIDTKEDKEDS